MQRYNIKMHLSRGRQANGANPGTKCEGKGTCYKMLRISLQEITDLAQGIAGLCIGTWLACSWNTTGLSAEHARLVRTYVQACT